MEVDEPLLRAGVPRQRLVGDQDARELHKVAYADVPELDALRDCGSLGFIFPGKMPITSWAAL